MSLITFGPTPSMSFRRLKWLAILAPIGFLGIVEYARYALGPALPSWEGRILMNGVVLLCALFFYGAVFTILGQMRERLESRNRELAALHSAGLDVHTELSLDTVLRKVVDLACNLLATKYGALSVIDEHGKIQSFVTCGLDDEAIEEIGAPPVGQGLLGVVLREGQRLRLDDMSQDSRSQGFPDHHPAMSSLLAVPIVCRGPFVGNLYLSEKLDGSKFSDDDEETLARFATQAAIAVDNAHLHHQVSSLAAAQERLRLAHELHDGQAQVLAYVNTKAQAVQEFLKAGQNEKAAQQLEQLAAAARQVYADVREGILGLREAANTEYGFTEALRRHLETWQDRSGIRTDLEVQGDIHLEPDTELQLLRITQEALANVRKHSEAKRAAVSVEAKNGNIRICVEDDGVGFRLNADRLGGRPRFGLSTMRERAEAIGAELELQSDLGVGTRVELSYSPTKSRLSPTRN